MLCCDKTTRIRTPNDQPAGVEKTHAMNRFALLLLAFLASTALVAGCSSSHSGAILCTTADGHGLAAGEAVPGAICQVCDARAGRILPRWEDGCGVTVDHTYDTVAVNGDILKVSPDMDGDGMPELFVSRYAARWNDASSSDGAILIVNVLSGDIVYQAEGTAEHPLGGAQDVGADLNADGLADFVYVESASLLAGELDRHGGPPDPDDRPNVVHVRSLAQEEDLWTVTGPGGCHALGATGVLFVPDYDGDGISDVAMVDPGCIAGQVPPRVIGEGLSSDDTANLTLRSGADGTLIRMWARPPPVGPVGTWLTVWGGRTSLIAPGLHLMPDQDGDAKPEIAVDGDFFSVQRDTPIAQIARLPGIVLSSQTMLGSDITGDGDVNMVDASAQADGTIELTIFGHITETEHTSEVIVVRMPGGSDTRHEVAVLGQSDVNGDGQQEIMLLDTDYGLDRDGRPTRLVAVSLDGDVLWQPPSNAWSPPITNAILDLDADGRDDFVTVSTRLRAGDSLHLELSSGLPATSP